MNVKKYCIPSARQMVASVNLFVKILIVTRYTHVTVRPGPLSLCMSYQNETRAHYIFRINSHVDSTFIYIYTHHTIGAGFCLSALICDILFRQKHVVTYQLPGASVVTFRPMAKKKRERNERGQHHVTYRT